MASANSDNRIGSLTWGVLLALAGIGLLLFNLDLLLRFEPYIQYAGAALLGLLALGFIGSYLSAPSHWWRLIPGWTLIALGVMIYLTTVRQLDQRVTAAALFVGQAIAFAHVYLLDRAERWWAIIPGGFMLMLGVTIALSSITEEPAALGTALFIGLGAVFFLLYLLGRRRQLWWALIPGSVLILFGLILFTAGRSGQNIALRWWPLLVFLLGVLLIWRATRPPSSRKLATNTAPKQERAQDQGSAGRPRRQPFGEYRGPAPGATIEVLPDPEES